MANPDNLRPDNIIAAPTVQQRIEMLRSPLVHVYAGKRERLHKIPKQLLRNTSQEFQDWLDKLEAEGEPEPLQIAIHDISNSTFKVLLEYMYDGKMSPGAIKPMKIGVEGLRECRKIIEITGYYSLGRAACVGLHDAIKNLIHHHFPKERWNGATRPVEDHLHVYIIVNQEIPGYTDHTDGLVDKLMMVINSAREEPGAGQR